MKDTLLTAVPFNAAAKTLDFSGVAGFDIRNLWAVINLTRDSIIYAIGTTGKGYSLLAGTTVTLDFDTTTYADTDTLFVIYSSPESGGATEAKQDAIVNKMPPISTLATGTITTQNLVPAGTATAGSAVEIVLNGASGLQVQITGTYTGVLSLQVTVNGTNWITVGGIPFININTGGYLASITSALQGIFKSEVAGALKARITGLAAMTGTATVTINSIPASSMVALDASVPTGTNAIGTVQPGNTANTTPWLTTNVPSAAQGYSTMHKLIAGASTNATSVKSSAGTVGMLVVSNIGAPKYLKMYNKASAPVVGTDVPVFTLYLPSNGAIPISVALGMRFSTGIAYALVTGIADSDATAIAASEVAVFINYV